MRPTKQQTDLEYWAKAGDYWRAMAEQYRKLDDAAGEARCEQKKEEAILKHQEAQGLIVVYTGRAAPRRSWSGVWNL